MQIVLPQVAEEHVRSRPNEELSEAIVARFRPMFEGRTTDDVWRTYHKKAKPARPYCQKGDFFIFAGDFGHAGWSNADSVGTKRFLFVDSRIGGQYCDAKGKWTSEYYWGFEKMALVKKHMAAVQWNKTEINRGLNTYFHNREPQDPSQGDEADTRYMTVRDHNKYVKEHTDVCLKYVEDYVSPEEKEKRALEAAQAAQESSKKKKGGSKATKPPPKGRSKAAKEKKGDTKAAVEDASPSLRRRKPNRKRTRRPGGEPDQSKVSAAKKLDESDHEDHLDSYAMRKALRTH